MTNLLKQKDPISYKDLSQYIKIIRELSQIMYPDESINISVDLYDDSMNDTLKQYPKQFALTHDQQITKAEFFKSDIFKQRTQVKLIPIFEQIQLKSFKDIDGYFKHFATGQTWLKIDSNLPVIIAGKLTINAVCVDSEKLGKVGSFLESDEVIPIEWRKD